MRETTNESKANIIFHALATSNGFEASLDQLKAFQKVSKIPGVYESNKKTSLAKMLARFAELDTQHANLVGEFWPKTFLLPSELSKIESILKKNEGKRQSRRKTLIAKPSSGSQGEGISLLQTVSDLRSMMQVSFQNNRTAIVQEYLPKPFLLRETKRKFDLRCYVLVQSVDPLIIHLHKEGLARFCTEDYEQPNQSNLHDSFKHLTNYSLNKRSENYIHRCDNSEDEGGSLGDGSKRTLTSVLAQMFADTKEDDDTFNLPVFYSKLASMSSICLKAMQPCLINAIRKVRTSGCDLGGGGSFHILGLDVLIDEDFNPWLLEMNANPSMRMDFEEFDNFTGRSVSIVSRVDEYVKGTIMTDFMNVICADSSSLISKNVINVDCSGLPEVFVSIEKIYSSLTKRETRVTLSKNRFLATKILGVKASMADIDLVHQRWSMRVSEENSRNDDVSNNSLAVVELIAFSDLVINLANLDQKDGKGDSKTVMESLQDVLERASNFMKERA